MRRHYNKYRLPHGLRKFRDGFEPFCLPIACFQLIRTILSPSLFDILLLLILFGLFFCYRHKWI
ncbi:MAG TPA: hypothetical protein VFK37_09835 [Bacillales bacterium]|nr:hypothetical protein [Bacillales bacterium]